MADSIISSTAASAVVTGAIKKASASTGVGFDYLYKVAVRESSLNPQAQAKTSSAAGLFQFIEQTWLGAVKKYGAAHGLSEYAADIQTAPNGRMSVASEARREEILNLRFDPEKAAALAGELARENKAALETGLGRAVDAAELYAAHFLGAGGAKKLLSANPSTSAASLLPAAAKANAHVFFDGARARTVSEVVDSFRNTIGEAKDAIATIGDKMEKRFAPLLRDAPLNIFEPAETRASAVPTRPTAPERAAYAPLDMSAVIETKSTPFFNVKGLSPLALAVLQALDPRELTTREKN